MRLSRFQTAAMIAAAERSSFGPFWVALIDACQLTGMAPARLLGPIGVFRFKALHRAAVERLRAVECPFDLERSRWGHDAMLRAFRQLAASAGLDGAEDLGFEALYS